MFTTWIRVENNDGQFDIREDAPLPEGARVVKDYPTHFGMTGRPGKPRVSLGGTSDDQSKALSKKNKAQLVEEAEALGLEVPSSATKADLIEQITAHDDADDTASPEPGEPTNDDADGGDTEQEN